MSKPINVYAVPEVRQALEEALPEIFSRLGYKQTFKLVDTKLVLGYLLIGLAALSFLLDKKLPWNDSKIYQKVLVGSYFIVSVVQALFHRYVEKGIVYEGVQKDRTVHVGTEFKKFSHEFTVTIKDDKNHSLKLNTSFTKFFTEKGYLQTDVLFKWFRDQMETLIAKEE